MKTKRKFILAAAPLLLPVACLAKIPYGNGTWTYDALYDSNGHTITVTSGLFVGQIGKYNSSTTSQHQITQIFPYGGDLELYCNGSGGSNPTPSNCSPNSFLVSYYPPYSLPKSKNNWDFWYNGLGDSGFRSAQAYRNIPGVQQMIVTIDGRLDNNPADDDYLNHLNDLPQAQAEQFADVVAKSVCADDNIDGVQFDIEPFSFVGKGGKVTGLGQRYFYARIAKDFSGNFNPGRGDSDPLNCKNTRHPDGRIFSVFAFADDITPDVANVLNQYGNGYVVDSLYDLGNQPGGTYTTPDQSFAYATNEIAKIGSKGVPYQLAIPGAASAHEFVSNSKSSGGAADQDLYVSRALQAISAVRGDPNFKGIALWGFVAIGRSGNLAQSKRWCG